MRTKPGVDSLSFDDLYNNLRVFESDIKGSTASSSSPQNVAFVSENSSSTNEVSTAYCVPNLSGQNSKYEQTSSYSLLANQSSCPQLDHEDLEQIDEYDLEEMDFEVASSHDLNEMKKGTQDNRRRDAWNSGNKDGSRTVQKEIPKAIGDNWMEKSDKYCAENLKKFDFANVKTASIPIETSESPLVKDKEASDVDVHLYRSLQSPLPISKWLVREFLVFVPKGKPNKTGNPQQRYLKGKPKLGLWYPRVSSFDLESYSDSDYVRANLGRRLISWQCKKQTIVATSTIEAEYVAAASCYGQVLWIQKQMLDYGFNFMNTKIYIDNESTICIVKNPVYHSKTKHIAIRHHFIRDAYEKKLIQVLKIHTDDNVADLLTKAFDVSRESHPFVCYYVGTLTPGLRVLLQTDHLKPTYNPLHAPLNLSVGSLEVIHQCKSLSENEGDMTIQVLSPKQGRKFAKSTDKDKVSTDMEKVSTDRPIVSTDGSKVSTDRQDKGTEKHIEGTDEHIDSTDGQRKGTEDHIEEASATQATQTPTSTIFRDDETIAKVLLNMSQAKASLGKGVRKKKIKEEDESESESDGIPEAEKKFKQLESDEEMARKIQEEWEGKEERNRIAEEKAANEALIRNFDDIKARIEADRLLAEKLQEQEREQFTIEERAKFLHDYIAAQRRFLAQQDRSYSET
ncbi:hypothetical protein Tco_1078394 [Tanacetum coccineum]|uniref:Uncharacterized protein n=1 Tax=Tanacetum coccineum TaxID=301880 RepID=A0ABQ5HQ61_9ASTR